MSVNAIARGEVVLQEIAAKIESGEWSLPDSLMKHVRSVLCAAPTTEAETKARLAHIIDPEFMLDFLDMIDNKGAEDEWEDRWSRWLDSDRWRGNLAKIDAMLVSGLLLFPVAEADVLPAETVAWGFIDHHQACENLHPELTDLVRRARNDGASIAELEKPAP